MTGPLILGCAGASLVVVSAMLSWVFIRPRRYEDLKADFFGQNPRLVRLVIHQGRLTALTVVGSALQLLALVWQGVRSS